MWPHGSFLSSWPAPKPSRHRAQSLACLKFISDDQMTTSSDSIWALVEASRSINSCFRLASSHTLASSW